MVAKCGTSIPEYRPEDALDICRVFLLLSGTVFPLKFATADVILDSSVT